MKSVPFYSLVTLIFCCAWPGLLLNSRARISQASFQTLSDGLDEPHHCSVPSAIGVNPLYVRPLRKERGILTQAVDPCAG